MTFEMKKDRTNAKERAGVRGECPGIPGFARAARQILDYWHRFQPLGEKRWNE